MIFKKSEHIFACCLGAFALIVVSVISYKIYAGNKAKNELAAFNNEVYSKAKLRKPQNILCLSGQRLYTMDIAFDEYDEGNLKEFEFQYNAIHSADYILPIKTHSHLFLLQSHCIKITDYKKEFLFEIKHPQSIWAMTYPMEDGDAVFFHILVWDNNSKELFLKKVLLKEQQISVEAVSKLELPNDFSGNMGFVEIAFFEIKSDMVYLAFGKLYCFSIDGKLVGELGDASLIVPNIYDGGIYYLSNATDKDERISSEYNLVKDDVAIAKIECPILNGYFVSSDTINFLLLDSTQTTFDFVNGPWQPVEFSCLYNIETREFTENYFKYPWKKGNFLTKSKVKNFHYVIVE